MKLVSAALLASLPLAFVLGAGCAGSDSVDGGESADDGAAAIVRSEAVERADQWVNAQLHYCQAPNHARDYDADCSSTCNRTDNADWDPYRSDCSGLVSWAWGLPAPGRVTWQFAPFATDISHVIDGNDLEPGDAVNSDGHIMLFKQWTNPGHEAIFIEEPGCSSSKPYAHELTSSVSINGDSVYISYEGKSFHAIRYDGIGDDGPPTQAVAQKPAGCGTFEPGQGLGPGDAVQSCDGRFALVMQLDGNLVLYQGGEALWATGTDGRGGYTMFMQGDGNFVLYSGHGEALWNSRTDGNGGARLVLQDDGNLVVYATDDRPLWASDTCCR